MSWDGWDANQLPAHIRKKLNLPEKKERAKSQDREHREQVAVINWADEEVILHPELEWLYAVPNAGLRSRKLGARLRAEGLRAGVWDLCLPAVRRGYPGLYIEMKFGNNKLTPHQERFRDHVLKEGYCAAVCYTADDAIAVLRWYLGLTPNKPDCVCN